MSELSDADVFGAPAPAAELSDADVFSHAPAAQPMAPVSGQPDGWSGAALPMVNQTSVGSVMRAFGEGFGEAWGPEKLGLSNDSVKWLSQKGVFAPAGQAHFENPFHAFNEGVIVPAATILDAAIRLPGALYHGAQEAGMAAGLHRDIVSLPDAFMGSPGALGKVEMRPGLPKHPETPPLPEGMPENFSVVTEAPKQPKDAPYIVAYHGTPHDFERFDLSKIGTGEGAQVYGHGLYFAEEKNIAAHYATALSPSPGSIPEIIKGALKKVDNLGFDSAGEAISNIRSHPSDWMERWGVEDSDTAQAINKYIQENPRGNVYQVRINADPDKFLDWDKPLNEQPDIRDKLNEAGILPSLKEWSSPDENGYINLGNREGGLGARIKIKPDSDGYHKVEVSKLGASSSYGIKGLDAAKIAAEENLQSKSSTSFGDYVNYLARSQKGGASEAAEAMMRAGIPGIKYLDQGSRDIGTGTRNYVVFNDSDIDITHKNGLPVSLTSDAKDLGVIGPEKPPIADAATPKEAAEQAVPRTMAAEGPKGEKVTQEVGSAPDPWQQRFEHFVSRLEQPEDVKNLIRQSAKENGDFLPARQGAISLGQVDSVAQAAGVDASEINPRGLGRRLQNDNEVRIAMQAMIEATNQVQEAARNVRDGGDEAALAKLQESIMRRDLAVEQVVGLRAEWGRTGNVIQEFMTKSKEENGLSDFLKGKGRTPKDLRDIADALDGISDPTSAARLLNDLRTPTAWDKFKWYWVNSLISGPTTHAKYILANAAFAGYESAVVTPVAGVVGTARRALTGGAEGVYLGEAAARTWGIVAGVPDALKAAVQAAKSGLQTPLPGELAQGIIPKQNKNLPHMQKPIPGALGTFVGLPSRGASAIHSFFNFLGYRASIEAQAYRQAAAEGLKPSDDAFWQRQQAAAGSPTSEMMDQAIEEGYRLTYISDLGETGKKLASFVNSTKVGQLIMPFVHIPMNILGRALEGTPAGFLSADTREALSGRAGAVKQDQAIARMVVGSAIGAWAVNKVMNDGMTGYGPTDQKERAQWLATGHQPYSIRIGDEWLSFNRFGSLGTMLGLYSNLAEVIPHMKPDAEELTKGIALAVHSTGRLMEDEVGMQGLAGLMEAIDEPERKGARFVSNFAGSLLPYSSALRQTASAMDPDMREAKTVVDGLRYYIPSVRQGLLPKRDWSGTPIANAGYGGDIAGAPGLSAVIQHRNAIADPVAMELAALDIKPAPPEDRIKGVKLPPALYDQYQSTAGPFTRTALEMMIRQPGWHDIPPYARAEVVRSVIRSTRETAQTAMQMAHPEIIAQGVQDRMNRINGVKPTKLKDPN